jgi:hypothetical protein
MVENIPPEKYAFDLMCCNFYLETALNLFYFDDVRRLIFIC